VRPVTLCLVAVAIFAVNIAFGYWRAAVPRFSRQWLAAIHLPVPALIALRFATGLGWAWTTYPVLVGAFFLGQLTGGQVRRFLNRRLRGLEMSGCLVWDLVRWHSVRYQAP